MEISSLEQSVYEHSAAQAVDLANRFALAAILTVLTHLMREAFPCFCVI